MQWSPASHITDNPAHETLTNPERRRQFDSIDWNIEDEIPDLRSIPADKFCSVIAPIFAREGRFSNVQPVAAFGDNEAPKKDVEGFYDFWYNFDSWRSFEWHDKEVNEGSDSYAFCLRYLCVNAGESSVRLGNGLGRTRVDTSTTSDGRFRGRGMDGIPDVARCPSWVFWRPHSPSTAYKHPFNRLARPTSLKQHKLTV